MNPFELLCLSIAFYVIGAVLSLILAKIEKIAIFFASIFALVGGIAGICAALPVLRSGQVLHFVTQGPFSFTEFSLRLDPLAAFMLFVISLLVVIVSIYSLAYMREYLNKGAYGIGFFMNLFIASMAMLVVSDNAFYFIIFFEMMSLASYFLVICDQSESSIKAGLLYFLIAHAGSVLIMIAFYLLYRHSGSLDFESFRQVHLHHGIEASVIFILAFLGFGAKAGMMPLHGWLPKAHPAAPSHASALMSGVMVKIGIFGIIKVGMDLLGPVPAEWWGIIVLLFGAVSSVLGVLYALTEHDIKRLLAYHTVENVGIILMGVGVAMVGMATGHPVIAAIGLLGGLYHLLNHAVFKALLFLGAGSVIYRMHTKDMEKMGGLSRVMPYTALAFLIGCLAISALPPLNGFVSEWFTYQSLFSLSHDGDFLIRIVGVFGIVMLAITGALAAMCFVKVYGISFSGAPRSTQASKVKEAPWLMVIATAILAVICIVLGVGANLFVPTLTLVANSITQTAPIMTSSSITLVPGQTYQAMLSTPLVFILLIVFPLLPLVIYGMFKGNRQPYRRKGTPWACGYEYSQDMAASAGSFMQPLKVMFAPLYRLRQQLDPSHGLQRALEGTTAAATAIEPSFDNYLIAPIGQFIQWVGRLIQRLQFGDFRMYCVYVVIAFLVLLLVTFA